MAKSMTGYGRFMAQEKGWNITWEIRSLNSRYLDLKWKIPPSLFAHQKNWEQEVKGLAQRGGIELFLRLTITDPTLQSLTLDSTQAQAMLAALSALAQETEVNFVPDLNRLLSIPSLWKDAGSIDFPQLVASLTHSLVQALVSWDATRAQEGQALVKDLLQRFDHLAQIVAQIKDLAQSTAAQRFELMHERINKLMAETNINIDPDRMVQELAIIADRIDISEELTRLEIHLQGIKNILHDSAPMGRKLDFMVQECFREINTCGNKSQNTDISQLVVNFKAELEKCREQIQNLE